MKKALIISVLSVLFPLLGRSQIVDEVPRQTVVEWLARVDAGKYEESWKTASPFFQKASSMKEWVEKIGRSRSRMGLLQEREFIKGRFLRDPDGVPTGEYFALEFETEFEKTKITEIVVVMRDQTGLWQVSSYSVSDQSRGR